VKSRYRHGIKQTVWLIGRADSGDRVFQPQNTPKGTMVTKNVLAIPLPTSHVLCQTSRQPDVDDSETPLRTCFGIDDPRAEKTHKTLRRPLATVVRTNRRTENENKNLPDLSATHPIQADYQQTTESAQRSFS
jgi:hypothetical protein